MSLKKRDSNIVVLPRVKFSSRINSTIEKYYHCISRFFLKRKLIRITMASSRISSDNVTKRISNIEILACFWLGQDLHKIKVETSDLNPRVMCTSKIKKQVTLVATTRLTLD